MIEVYLMQLCRDVYFRDYGTGLNTDANGFGGSLTNDAVAVLQSLGAAYHGPRNAMGDVDIQTLFRGDAYGSILGIYNSQFSLFPLINPVPAAIGRNNLNLTPFTILYQRWAVPGQREFGVSFADFVAIENGKVPNQYVSTDFDPIAQQYVVDGRNWGSFVHFDTDCESFYYATYILNGYGFPYSSALPYYNGSAPNETGFGTFGMIDVFSMVEAVTGAAMRAAWAQKWRVNRALRPEAFGGLVQNVKVTGLNPFDLNELLFVPHAGIDVLARVLAKNTQQAGFPANNLTPSQAATYLNAQMYPEGSPAHPTYPSGHATVAGACATILKAFFEDTTLIKNIVTPVTIDPSNPALLVPLVDPSVNQMTVASELDKLASNVAMARCWAGVHWRIDGEQGILLGEAVAIKYLQDYALTYTEQTFEGFTLTKRDGTRIRITATDVTVI
jgi:membrane-associated phospholipid phosphatase